MELEDFPEVARARLADEAEDPPAEVFAAVPRVAGLAPLLVEPSVAVELSTAEMDPPAIETALAAEVAKLSRPVATENGFPVAEAPRSPNPPVNGLNAVRKSPNELR